MCRRFRRRRGRGSTRRRPHNRCATWCREVGADCTSCRPPPRAATCTFSPSPRRLRRRRRCSTPGTRHRRARRLRSSPTPATLPPAATGPAGVTPAATTPGISRVAGVAGVATVAAPAPVAQVASVASVAPVARSRRWQQWRRSPTWHRSPRWPVSPAGVRHRAPRIRHQEQRHRRSPAARLARHRGRRWPRPP